MLTKDVEASKGQLKCGRAASTVARGDRDSTGARVSELKAATEVAGGEHQHFQHHAASQLQSLGFVAKNEEHKGGEQVMTAVAPSISLPPCSLAGDEL